MTADQPTTGPGSGPTIRTDGGSSMPGVPDEDGDDDTAEPEPTSESEGRSATSSGSPMPGVPDSKGPEPAVNSGGGGSCETPEHHDDEGGETHDLTTVFTFNALAKTRDPASVVQSARSWSDWVGIVGRVDAPTLNTFLRRQNVDIDFFNGANDPQTRLARVASEGSAFYSERLVMIGVEGEREFLPGEDWEFEPLEPTAEEAGWTLQ